MTTATGMGRVLSALRDVRALAINTLKTEHPDLYELSAQAFEVRAPGSIAHHARLGEYLTEWDNGLGRSPVEALAGGRHAEVRRELEERAGIGSEDE